jgi:hypothetical protein
MRSAMAIMEAGRRIAVNLSPTLQEAGRRVRAAASGPGRHSLRNSRKQTAAGSQALAD